MYTYNFSIVFYSNFFYSQNVGINSNGANPNASALLDIDVSSLVTKKGLLIPRLTLAERTAMNPLPSAAQGLLVYQTNGIEGFYYNVSTSTIPNWVYLYSSNSGSWLTNGNVGTTPSTAGYGSSVSNNFIGTTDNVDFVIATNNLERMRITNAGNILLGTSSSVTNARLSIKDGHIQTSQTTAPTIVVSPNAGTLGCTTSSASASLLTGSNDITGQVTLIIGGATCTNYLAGPQCTVTFNKSYTKAPIVLLTPCNSSAAGGTRLNFVSSTTTGLV